MSEYLYIYIYNGIFKKKTAQNLMLMYGILRDDEKRKNRLIYISSAGQGSRLRYININIQ